MSLSALMIFMLVVKEQFHSELMNELHSDSLLVKSIVFLSSKLLDISFFSCEFAIYLLDHISVGDMCFVASQI